MQLTRRKALAIGGSGILATAIPHRATATTDALINEFTGGTETQSGALRITAPEVAENGSAVAIEVECPGARSIRILAPSNPSPEVCTFNFGPLAGNTVVSTRIRMAETQDLIALAEMADGSFQMTTTMVSVTVGGCSG